MPNSYRTEHIMASLKRITLVAMIAVTFAIIASSASAVSLNIPIITGPDSQWNPDISGNYITYTDTSTGLSFVYDWQKGKTTQLPRGAVHPQIFGDYVVYDNTATVGASPFQVYLYSLTTRKAVPISNAADSNGAPSIWGNNVVWTQATPDALGSNIVLYNIRTKVTTQLTNTSSRDESGLSAVGDKWVTWTVSGPPAGDSIYAYNLATRQTRLVDSQPGAQYSRTSGNVVVWHDQRRGSDYVDVYMMNLVTNSEQLVSNGVDSAAYPDISGSNIVYTDLDSNSGDIQHHYRPNNRDHS